MIFDLEFTIVILMLMNMLGWTKQNILPILTF